MFIVMARACRMGSGLVSSPYRMVPPMHVIPAPPCAPYEVDWPVPVRSNVARGASLMLIFDPTVGRTVYWNSRARPSA